MAYDSYEHFIAIVAGDNPDELMKKYDKKSGTEPYVVYKKKDAGKLKEQYKKYYAESLKLENLTEEEKQDIEDALSYYNTISDEEFFNKLTEDYEKDTETGDAISRMNPQGKWESCCIGKLFSIPFLTKNGEEKFQAKKGEIEWEKIHLNGQETYRTAWELVMENRTPVTDDEKTIYENMKNRTGYFSKFETKENYVTSCTAFWGFAFLSEETGWRDLDEEMDQFVWMSNFYDLFIKPLPDNTLLTIYECCR